MVAAAFKENGKYGSSSIKQTAQTAMRLMMDVLITNKIIVNREKPELCLQSERLNKHISKTVEEIMKVLNSLS